MKSILQSLVLVGFFGVVATAYAHGDEHKEKVTLTGEVLDLACYFQHPKTGSGPEHTACARQCINKGLPAGLKVGKKLYLLLGKGHDPVADVISSVAGKQATITGALIEQHGVKAIVVEKATEVKGG